MIAGRFVASILSTARSVLGSVPTRRALIFAPVVSCNTDVRCPRHHVVVGEDITIGADDYPRTEAPLALLLRTSRWVGVAAKIVSEKLPEERIHGHHLGHLPGEAGWSFDNLGGRDVHNFRQRFLDYRCKTIPAGAFLRVCELQRCRRIGGWRVASQAADSQAAYNQS